MLRHIAKKPSAIIGIDLGGTKTAIARFDAAEYTVESQDRIPTRKSEGFSAVLQDVIDLAKKHITPEVGSIGIGVPGFVKQPDGTLIKAPNIPGSDGVAIKQDLEAALGLPVFVNNDANCFALGEARAGAGRGGKVVVGITLGTGVGGGIVINDHIFSGAHGYAAEIGHMLLMPMQPPYPTDDKRGEVEQFLSGTAFGKRCEAAQTPKDFLEGDVCTFMHPDVYREIAWLCVNLTHCLDPDIIVLGGTVGHAFKPHLESIRTEFHNWVLPGTPAPVLKIAELPNAGLLGAALLGQ